MEKKELFKGAALLGVLLIVLVGMAWFQASPQQEPVQTAYELKGFPSLPVSNQ